MSETFDALLKAAQEYGAMYRRGWIPSHKQRELEARALAWARAGAPVPAVNDWAPRPLPDMQRMERWFKAEGMWFDDTSKEGLIVALRRMEPQAAATYRVRPWRRGPVSWSEFYAATHPPVPEGYEAVGNWVAVPPGGEFSAEPGCEYLPDDGVGFGHGLVGMVNGGTRVRWARSVRRIVAPTAPDVPAPEGYAPAGDWRIGYGVDDPGAHAWAWQSEPSGGPEPWRRPLVKAKPSDDVIPAGWVKDGPWEQGGAKAAGIGGALSGPVYSTGTGWRCCVRRVSRLPEGFWWESPYRGAEDMSCLRGPNRVMWALVNPHAGRVWHGGKFADSEPIKVADGLSIREVAERTLFPDAATAPSDQKEAERDALSDAMDALEEAGITCESVADGIRQLAADAARLADVLDGLEELRAHAKGERRCLASWRSGSASKGRGWVSRSGSRQMRSASRPRACRRWSVVGPNPTDTQGLPASAGLWARAPSLPRRPSRHRSRVPMTLRSPSWRQRLSWHWSNCNGSRRSLRQRGGAR